VAAQTAKSLRAMLIHLLKHDPAQRKMNEHRSKNNWI
jgi:hypothetical protein